MLRHPRLWASPIFLSLVSPWYHLVKAPWNVGIVDKTLHRYVAGNMARRELKKKKENPISKIHVTINRSKEEYAR